MKPISLFICALAITLSCRAQTLLYQNDFETPNFTPPGFFCQGDFSILPVDSIFGGTGTGINTNVRFKQITTVETLLLKKTGHAYNDPLNIGQNYALGFQNAAEDDKLAFTINRQQFPRLNVSFNLSGISSGGGGCGLLKPNDVPVFNVKLFNTPTGSFSFIAPGTLLDQKSLSGNFPDTTNFFTFNWSLANASLNAANSTNGLVTLVFDLLQGTYASIDNIIITGDSMAFPLTLKSFDATNSNHSVLLRWQTVSEVNCDYFDVECSYTGSTFFRIGRIAAKSLAVVNDYNMVDSSQWQSDKKYYRLKMVDKDGSFTYSPIRMASGKRLALDVYPNPILNRQLVLRYNTFQSSKLLIQLFAAQGKLVFEKILDNNMVSSTLLLPAQITSGIYVVKVTSQSNECLLRKLVLVK